MKNPQLLKLSIENEILQANLKTALIALLTLINQLKEKDKNIEDLKKQVYLKEQALKTLKKEIRTLVK